MTEAAASQSCLACQRRIRETANYCPFCGGKQADLLALIEAREAAKRREEEARQKQKPAPNTQTEPTKGVSSPPKKSSSVTFVVAAVVFIALALGGIGLLSGSNVDGSASVPDVSQSQTQSPEPTPTKTVRKVSYSELAGSIAAAFNAKNTCDALGAAVNTNTPNFFPARGVDVMDEVRRITSASTARTYVADNRSWLNGDFIALYEESIHDATRPELDALIQEYGLDSDDVEIDISEFEREFSALSIETCGRGEEYELIREQLREFAENVERVKELAK